MNLMETPVHPPAPPETPIGNAVDDVDSSDKRRRQPRNSACQPCASLKMKCVASMDGGKCERCNRMGRDCIPAVPKPRKRKTDDAGFESPSGVALSNFMDGNISARPSTAGVARPLSSAGPTTETKKSIDALMTRSDIRHNGSKSFATLFARGLGLGDLPQGIVIDHQYISSNFTVFRQFSAHFPFVSNLLGADPVIMVAQRPFTTAAVCTVTTASNPRMQEDLSKMFRFALSTKALVEGERSTDLMIGLLIYLAWHHHYMSRPQIYQDLCLLAGMAADLGLYRRTPSEDTGGALERDRAFLGCYYLCCGLSRKGFNKPNPLRWTDHLRRYAEDITRSGSVPSDQSLVPMVELAHILEELEDNLLQSRVDLKPSTISYAYEMHAKAANHRLKGLKREHPMLAGHPAFSAAMIDIHHQLLTVSDAPDTSTLIQCACAIKEYFDDILSRPPIVLHQISIIDWTNLLEVITLLVKVSKPLPNNAGWEAGALTSMLQPGTMLDALCTHMASAPAADALAPKHEPLLQALRSFCKLIKAQSVDGSNLVDDLPLPYSVNGVQPAIDNSIFSEGVLSVFFRDR